MDERNTATLVRLGALLGEAARARMLISLLDGRQRPATELAQLAAVTPQTASAHLRHLSDAGALQVIAQGRHRYYRLSSEEWAEALEALMAVRVRGQPRRSVPEAPVPPLARARLCYRHLAGSLGVAWAEALQQRAYITAQGLHWRLSPDGFTALVKAGLLRAEDTDNLHAKPCLDWTERRQHLAGPLANCLTQRMLERRWLLRAREARVVLPTPEGERRLRELGVRWRNEASHRWHNGVRQKGD
jgi:DNA-binding transcriptional ArsR family regulator